MKQWNGFVWIPIKDPMQLQEKQIEMDYSRINGFVEMLKEIGLCSSFEESLQNSISAL